MAGEQRVRELRQHGVLVADDAVDERFARRQLAHRVGADLFLDWPRHPAAGAESPKRCRTASCAASVCLGLRARCIPPNVPAVDLTGPWRARPGDGDLAKQFADPAFDERRLDDGRAPAPLAHGRRVRGRATDRSSTVARSRTRRPRPGAGRFLESTASSTTATRGSTATTSARPRATSSRTRSRSPTRCAATSDHVLALEVACPPQRDRTAKRTDHRRVRALGRGSIPAFNPGGPGDRCGSPRPDRVRIANLRVLCTEALEERGRLTCDITLDADEGPLDAVPARATSSTTTAATLLDAFRAVTLATGENQQSWTLDRRATRRGGGRGRSARNRCCTLTLSVVGRRRARATSARCAPRFATCASTTGSSRSTASACSSRARTSRRRAWRSPTPTIEEIRRDLVLAQEANLDFVRVHAHVARPELYDAADELGLLRVAGPPAAVGLRTRRAASQAARQARAMVDLLGHHPSVFLWCAHNAPFAADREPGEPWSRGALVKLAATRCAPDMGQGGARPLRRARARPARQHPAGRAPQRRAARHRRAGHRRAPLPRLVPRRSRRPRRARSGAGRASVASSPSSARRPCPRPPSGWSPNAGPTSTGTRSRAHHALQRDRLRAAHAARRREVVRRVARR